MQHKNVNVDVLRKSIDIERYKNIVANIIKDQTFSFKKLLYVQESIK